jgi:DnaJ-class molecular chaperone
VSKLNWDKARQRDKTRGGGQVAETKKPKNAPKDLECSRCKGELKGAGHIVRRYGGKKGKWWALCRDCRDADKSARDLDRQYQAAVASDR